MPFLHPGLLWFLPLAALPILLHLLTLHRLRSVDFHYVDASAEAEPVSEALGGQQEMWRPMWFILLFVIIVLEFQMATTSGRSRMGEENKETS